jgi:hypothetical protein
MKTFTAIAKSEDKLKEKSKVKMRDLPWPIVQNALCAWLEP